MDYKKSYKKAIAYLAEQGCPTCPPDDEIQDHKCERCMEMDADVLEKRMSCWNKKFIE